MNSLGSRRTRTTLTSEHDDISIKIEQDVLGENDTFGRSKIKVEVCDISKVKQELKNPSVSENIMNGIDDCNYNNTHCTFQPDLAIKTEPAVDIDDRQPDEESDELTNVDSLSANIKALTPPKVRFPQTNKLIESRDSILNKKKRYFCTYENCAKSYGKSSHLRSHLIWHTGIKPFVCKEPGCGKGFTRSDELNRHIRTHTGEKPFECVRCTKKFSRSDHLTKHLATHTKQLSTGNESLNIFKSTMLSSNVSNNQFAKNINFAETTASTSKNFNIVPENLNMKSKSLGNKNHDRDLTKQEKNVINFLTIPVQGSDVKDEFTTTVKSEPIEELHRVSNNDPDDDAIMPEANLPPLSHLTTFLKESTNNIESSVCDPTRPFPCCRCAKNFKRQEDLNRHMLSHTGEKPFTCNQCDKRFMRNDHLRKHLKTHTGVR